MIFNQEEVMNSVPLWPGLLVLWIGGFILGATSCQMVHNNAAADSSIRAAAGGGGDCSE
jgi:hypothetical protein